MKTKFLALICCGVACVMFRAGAITFSAFGPHGEGGSKNGQSFLIGPGGSVFELEAFLYVGGLDLNGSALGTTADLARDSLPAGLTYNFSWALPGTQSDLVLTYAFSNQTSAVFPDVRFLVMLDAEIDEATNTFFNEFGTLAGTLGHGAGDTGPDQWQMDEPGFQTGTLIRNLFLGSLSNSNAVPQTALNDTAMALGFSLGSLKPGEGSRVQVMISEANHSLSSFALTQHDNAPTSLTTITLSGSAQTNAAPFADASSLVQLAFEWRLNRPTGSLIGTLKITNPSTSGAPVGPPFHLGLHSSTNLYYVHAAGLLDNGIPYVDLTPALTAQLGNGPLNPGQSVVVTNKVIEVYSAGRSTPPSGQFEFWATRQ